ncbi:hybrid sensor histidine kinase/response regulator [Azospirillum sp. RWY-5-1]|uniref:histidine kinase n=1 Tax=Azospirillum oleiclasticum TaxID=2735135 RepID=A0ABX2T5N3_9PROT|nr:PAS domain-containing hybrid sensor histidine kinase/response regulator [Azospirillum oleiclasticum]NYZ11430.1 hybrid sensor histidine kinase/response regulator [Azospirillum oleiclasticum]NYZ18591.1 hybrid sensor histidine kinase/response regulator [Azospirillum oleiclasticum]
MIVGWAVLAVSLSYIGVLFAIAHHGDRAARRRGRPAVRPVVYALSLAVYCTTWTFYGSVGLAATTGYGFLPVYVGPILLFTLGWPLLHRIVRISKAQNITSVADFIAARYGKSHRVAAAVAIVAVVGTVPYIALQLKAVSASYAVLLQYPEVVPLPKGPADVPWRDTALVAAIVFALFAILFGTRRVDATEHHEGMILAIAAEAVMKLVAFLAVGTFVTWGLFDGPADLANLVTAEAGLRQLFGRGIDGGQWLTVSMLSALAILGLPRMFHVAIVENDNEANIRVATWLFPAYLLAINLFVIPIAAAGLLLFPEGTVDPDVFVLALPMAGQQQLLTIIAFIGGLSAATGMVIVSSVAVSIMVSNDLIMPVLLRRVRRGAPDRADMRNLILWIRRATIVAMLLLAYLYFRVAGNAFPLASIGLISLAAVAQFAPALIGGLVWRGATSAGAFWGVATGVLVWAYTLLLPSFAEAGWVPRSMMEVGLGYGLLMPQQLFGVRFDPLVHGVVWSLMVNTVTFVAVSLRTVPRPIERLQASAFMDPAPDWGRTVATPRNGSVTMAELQAVAIRYLGAERAGHAFGEFAGPPSDTAADLSLVRRTERLLASAIGASSARLVLALVLERRNLDQGNALRLLDDASAAIQYNRDLLQTTIENVAQGIAVFDKDLGLVCWNQQFRRLLDLPGDRVGIGAGLTDLLRVGASRGDFGPGDAEDLVARETDRFLASITVAVEHRRPDGAVLEMRTSRMPGGGYVTTWSDITERVRAAATLASANAELERRVRERTAELAGAKTVAETANRDKTRFLAAASHDLLQPLNAARLYASSLLERQGGGPDATLAGKLDTALAAVEELLGELLDISKLDAGAVMPERSGIRLDALFSALSVGFAPLAERRGLRLRVVPSGLTVESDWRLLHRMLQNLLSNAIRYTPEGRVLMGARRSGDRVRIQVWDTGVGIPPDRQALVFKEFQRYADAPGVQHGLGLGLSIVERIARMLDHPVSLRSRLGRGTLFEVRVPLGTPAAIPSDAAAPARSPATVEQGTVLCLDNDASILDAMRTLHGGWGYRIVTAANLSEAKAAIGREAPSLIIVDVHLGGGKDGIASLAELRRRLDPVPPAIVVTADRGDDVKARARTAGVPLLNKPLRPAALRTLMRRLLTARRAAE